MWVCMYIVRLRIQSYTKIEYPLSTPKASDGGLIGAPRGRPTMPSVVAFNAKGDSIAGLKATRVKSDGEKQVILGPHQHASKQLPQNRQNWCGSDVFFSKLVRNLGFFLVPVNSWGPLALLRVFRSMKRLLGRTYSEAHEVGLRPSELGADPRGYVRLWDSVDTWQIQFGLKVFQVSRT